MRTAGDVRTSEERRRRADVAGGLSGPQHAETYHAAELSSADRTRAASYSDTDKGGLGQSTESNDPINIPEPAHDASGEGKPRRRKFFGRFNDKDEGDKLALSESQESMPDKQKFTVVGQLKATLFNSWINILLFAAPAGSKILLTRVAFPKANVYQSPSTTFMSIPGQCSLSTSLPSCKCGTVDATKTSD